MDLLQNLIQKLEVGGGLRYVRLGMFALAFLLVVIGYNWVAYKNMSTQEAMDAAQLGRNLAEGKGYTTLFVRPFSIYLVKRHNLQQQGIPDLGQAPDHARLKGAHPDIANPPVYPVVLAGLMKALPFRHDLLDAKPRPFWTAGGKFFRHQPDFLISAFNQLLFFGVVVLAYLLAARLFDRTVAWMSALLLFGTELLWRFSVSGLSTMLLLLIFMGLVWCLITLEQETREPRRGPAALLFIAAAAGALVGVGSLTRYSFGWLIVPVLLFLIFFSGRQRWRLALPALVAFALVLTPWVVRNYSVSGTPFGTAGYALLENSGFFPGDRLERSLEPDFSQVSTHVFWQKLTPNLRSICASELPRLGGTWVTAFFLVGLLVGFRSAAVTRLRYFLLACLAVLVLVQALGKTHLSEDSPEINSENLLVLVAPIVLIYGVALFYALLEQIELPFRELRYAVVGGFGVVACLPMLFALLPILVAFLSLRLPTGSPGAYPPYYPPGIQSAAACAKESELTMSDMPWAVAWYGQRQSVWLTLNAGPDFFAVNDYLKPVQALYLTRLMLDSRFLTQYILAGEKNWGTFVLDCLIRKAQPAVPGFSGSVVPPGFPLRFWQPGWPEQFLLTARPKPLPRP